MQVVLFCWFKLVTASLKLVLLLALLLGGPLLAAVIWFYQVTRDKFWIYAWLLMSGFMIFMTMFYSTLIVPLFNKQTPPGAG